MTRRGAAWLMAVSVLSLTAAAYAQRPAAPAPAEQYGTAIGGLSVPPPGASSCSGCHPISATVDTPVKRLIGRRPEEIVDAVKAFRSGEKPATIMDRIAKGFSDDEIKSIAEWYGAQKE